MGAPVVHWEINSKDAKRLWDFYSQLFGWNINSANPMNYGLVNTGSKSGINGGIAQAGPGMAGTSVTFYVEVDDPQAYLNRIESMGGRTVVPVTEIPQMVTFALFVDPEGNTIGLVKSMPQPKKAARPKKRVKRASRAKGRGARGRRK